jgi:hypothetical protein
VAIDNMIKYTRNHSGKNSVKLCTGQYHSYLVGQFANQGISVESIVSYQPLDSTENNLKPTTIEYFFKSDLLPRAQNTEGDLHLVYATRIVCNMLSNCFAEAGYQPVKKREYKPLMLFHLPDGPTR